MTEYNIALAKYLAIAQFLNTAIVSLIVKRYFLGYDSIEAYYGPSKYKKNYDYI